MSFDNITPLGPKSTVELAPIADAKYRAVDRVVVPMDTSDGAGVSLRRSIGSPKLLNLDPFLMLDEFKSDDPKDYEAGFPEHPHRGFETVTIMLHGNFKHQDSRGNTGYLTSGGVQWMTAGRGLIHSETPMQAEGLMWGYQLWVNLPAKDKMQEPRYQDIDAAKIPAVQLGGNGPTVRLVAGKIGDIEGPVTGISVNPIFLDVSVPKGETFEHPIPEGHTLFLFTSAGALVTADVGNVPESRLIVYKTGGNAIKVSAPEDTPARFLLVAGAPIKEPIAHHGPFVMNTRAELMQCFKDLENGTFDK